MASKAHFQVSAPRQSSQPKLVGNSASGSFIFALITAPPDHFHRLVPPQTPELVCPLVNAYIHSEFAKLNSKNTLVVEELHGGKPWVADFKHWNYEAAIKATEVRSISTVVGMTAVGVTCFFCLYRPCTNRHQTLPVKAVRSLSRSPLRRLLE